jgi:hypothetical protein
MNYGKGIERITFSYTTLGLPIAIAFRISLLVDEPPSGSSTRHKPTLVRIRINIENFTLSKNSLGWYFT